MTCPGPRCPHGVLLEKVCTPCWERTRSEDVGPMILAVVLCVLAVLAMAAVAGGLALWL